MIPQGDLDKIWEWNSALPAPVEQCVHEIIEDRAQSQPSSPAICAWDGELTYGELDQLATRLAGRLASLGVGPDVLVPLCFEKSMWTTVAMLAVLKAGGGFVLLDPSLPTQRLQTIVKQVKARLVLSSLSNRALSFQLAQDVVTVSLDLFTDLSDQAHGDLQSPSPSSIMYVIFTSGSTGTPKGVVLSHRNVASALHYQTKDFGFTAVSRIYDFASYSFDVSISNTFMGLTAGACLCVPSDQDRRNDLAQSIASLHANVVHLTPSVAQLLSPHLDKMPELQSIILGGEASRARDVEPWFGKTRLINTYGPAECTSTSTINCSTTSSPEEATSIGKGAGVVTWIVDPDNHNHLLPLGSSSIGELLLEGPLVGWGYLNDPEKTAAAFIDDPAWLLSLGRHGRLYKTGDLVRYNEEDGGLVFIGRKDTQVKIRGQRVELGEVEHHVHESIGLNARQVVAEVIVLKGDKSSPMLATFVQMNDTKPELGKISILPIAADVEAKMAERLPSYLVPTVFFSIPELPITVSGKIDRRQLRDVGGSFSMQQLAELRTARLGTKRQPTSPRERQMQRIWGEVLNIEPAAVGLDDSFFQLGGDSIAAMKVVGEARKIGVKLTAADIFSHATLGHVVSQGLDFADDDTPADILPFSLLDGSIDIASLLQDISIQCVLDPATIQDVYPCTPLQEGLLSLSSKRPGDYIMQAVLLLSPELAISNFRTAWEEVARKMAILRTRIVQHSRVHSDGLLQVVLNEDIHWVEATGLDRYIETDKKQPMETGRPLSRYALVKDDEGEYRWFVWTAHHALYDGWSLPLVFEAVNQAYRGHTPNSGCQFKSFIKCIGEQDDKQMSEYWQRTLAGCSSAPFPELPPSVQQPVANRVMKHQLPQVQTPSLDITTSTLIRAAWALVAGRMTNSEDVVFGVTVSGRNAPVVDIDRMAAPTIATVPLRVQLASDQRVPEYLEAVQRQATEMIPYEQTGLRRIAKLCPDAQQACMFQTLLVIQPQEKNSSVESVLGKWQDGSKQEEVSTYALALEIQLGEADITAIASFDSQVIEPWMVEKLLERLEFAMQQLAATDPEQKLKQIEMVTPHELEEIWQWNSTVPAPVDSQCVHEIFEERAREQPNSPAVCAWDGELTYGQLDELSTKLAGHLASLGLGQKPDVLVPLVFEKSMWTTVAMLGVLKAGGGFVLLDPSLPEQRLQGIAQQQVKASLVVSSVSNRSLSSRLAQDVVAIGADFFASDLGNYADQHLSIRPSPSSVVYVVFTSALHYQTKARFGFEGELRLFEGEFRLFDFASYAFDASVYNTFIALATGGCLCVPSDEDRRNDVPGSIARLKPNTAFLTPSVTQFLSPEEAPELQSIMFIGEALHTPEIKRWWGRVQVLNAYGPSECTPCSTINCSASSPEEVTRIGTGAGIVTWVMDPDNHNHLQPLGCIGELLLEGPLVGRGYLNEPEKTAAAFIEDPAWLSRGTSGQLGRRGRLYKTGDLVRCNEDGSLTYIGRKDTQVKIRGQRVELGEVEHHVQDCIPGARQVVAEVIVPQGENSRPMLAAFVQMDDDTAESDKPDPAGPRELPITPSGKTNRKQLRDIGGSFSVQQFANTRSQGIRQQPTSEAEQRMQRIWGKVLNIDPDTIGLNDSFFQLGGDSIAAMKAVAEARKVGDELVVADIFRHPTLMDLTHRESLSEEQGDGDQDLDTLADPVEKAALLAELDSQDMVIRSAAVADVLPVTSFQELLVFLRVTNYFYLDLGAGLDIARLEKSCSLLLETNPILRACFFPLLGRIRQVVLDQLDLPVRILDVDEDLDQSLRDFCANDITGLSPTGSPTGFALLRHRTQGVRFVLRLAHAQYDAMSINHVFQSLADAYNNKPLSPRPSFSRYLAYASRQKSKSMAYWKQLLQGSSLANLSKLMPKGPQASLPQNIQAEAEISLPQLSGNITAASLFSAAWAVLLSRINGVSDVAYCHVSGGRSAAVQGIDQMIGNCVNLVPMRVNVASLQTPAHLLLTVQEQFIALGEADSLGFRDIIENCTDWPAGSNFDTIIQHLSLDVNPEFQFSEASSTAKVFISPQFIWPCVFMESRPKGDRLQINLYANTHIMSAETADALVEGLCMIVENLTNCPDESLLSCIDGIDFEGLNSESVSSTAEDTVDSELNNNSVSSETEDNVDSEVPTSSSVSSAAEDDADSVVSNNVPILSVTKDASDSEILDGGSVLSATKPSTQGIHGWLKKVLDILSVSWFKRHS